MQLACYITSRQSSFILANFSELWTFAYAILQAQFTLGESGLQLIFFVVSIFQIMQVLSAI